MAAQLHVSVGNLNLDIIMLVPGLPGPEETIRAEKVFVGLGGSATNYAVAASILKQRVYLVTRIGREAEGLGFIKKLRETGIDLSYAESTDENMGIAVSLVLPGGYRALISNPGANKELRGSLIPCIKEEGLKILHLASVPPRVIIEAENVLSCYDYISYDPGAEALIRPLAVRNVLPKINTLFLNMREYESLFNNQNPAKIIAGAKGRLERIIVKRGPAGAVYADKNETLEVEPVRIGEPVDTTGAGDAFDAAFNIFIQEEEPLIALQKATVYAALKTLKIGASSMPSLEEFNKILAEITE